MQPTKYYQAVIYLHERLEIFRRWNHSTNHITVSPIEKLKAPPEILVSSTRYFCRQCGTPIFPAAAIVLMCVPVLVQTLKLTVNAALDLTHRKFAQGADIACSSCYYLRVRRESGTHRNQTAATTEKWLGVQQRIFLFLLHQKFNIRDNYKRRDTRGRESVLLQRINKDSDTCERKKVFETK